MPHYRPETGIYFFWIFIIIHFENLKKEEWSRSIKPQFDEMESQSVAQDAK